MRASNLFSCLGLALLLVTFTGGAGVKDTETSALKDLLSQQKALIQKLSEGHIEIIKSFPVSDEFQGFVAKTPHGKEVILYVNNKADTLFMGTMVSKDGTDLTAQYTQQYIYSDIAKAAYQDIAQTQWFQEGQDSAPHKVYAIIDPLCGYCKKQYASLKPLIEKGEVQVRWVMVGYLRPESAGIAVNVLMGATNQEKIERLAKQEQSGIESIKPDDKVFVTSGLFAAVSKNTAFFEKYSSHFIGTPTFVYINTAGQAQFHPGMIPQEQLQTVFAQVGKDWSVSK